MSVLCWLKGHKGINIMNGDQVIGRYCERCFATIVKKDEVDVRK